MKVHRLKPRFRQFILDGCKEPQNAEAGVRSTPLRGRMADVHGSWSARRGQELEGARKSLAFDSDENVMRQQTGTADISHTDDATAQGRSNRLQEIRRRMGGLGAREPSVGVSGLSGVEATVEVVTPSAAFQGDGGSMDRCECTWQIHYKYARNVR